MSQNRPTQIEIIGAKVNNLKNIDVNVPLNQLVAITGKSGSGKSSLAMGVLYSEGMRRYVSSLSTYTRRRLSQAKPTDATSIKHIPSAIALKQRPSVPDVRSTVGTVTEALNIVRLIFSRLGSPRCPNGHQVPPTLAIAQAMDLPNDGQSGMGEIVCPTCGVTFMAYSAEDFAFNAYGACPTCDGTGVTRQIDSRKLIPNPKLTIREGAVASWKVPGRSFIPFVVEAAGVDIDTPYEELSASAQAFVLHGERKEYEINIPTRTGKVFHMDHAVYENAYNAIEDTLNNTDNVRTIKRLDKFYTFSECPTCHGSRFNPKLLTQLLVDKNIAEVSDLELVQLQQFIPAIRAWLPDNMQALGDKLLTELEGLLQPLMNLGLDYLTLSRAGNTLSTGELQRIQLSRTLRTETTGVLYVLDEPSIGLHAANVQGLITIMKNLVEQGNSVVVVDHDPAIISAADHVIEIGPDSGELGGQVIAQGSVDDILADPQSRMAPFITGSAQLIQRPLAAADDLFKAGRIDIGIEHYHNIDHLETSFPVNRFTVVSGFSGAGKSTLVFDALIPALESPKTPPAFVDHIDNKKIKHVYAIDATPIGKNIRSTLATYTNVLDELRDLFAALPESQARGFDKRYFSYNLKQGACPTCNGTGEINLDIQYLPDMQQVCPTCNGERYNPEVLQIRWHGKNIADLLKLAVTAAIPVFADVPKIEATLKVLDEMGLGYIPLGESTVTLSGGESQRLRLSKYINKSQKGTLFVFDEPSIGLHPLDVQVLLHVLQTLIEQGGTVLAIEHDLDLIENADYVIDMGPSGGDRGGQIIASGTPAQVAQEKSLTGQYLHEQREHFHLDD
ncbi:excinuclease ABC subunit UvrA [Lacticaseibacillus saniviri]|uniref:UvrABC system protein A n=1 Tax=Lacticaseibacillus saniviri JCM 17471 = DSM 24301 TaxID=1293598 RepID=A0A0R2MPQ6_9LACO|nr:excinuclease ABC subunit UvrA [Lacticaseibacillus saniviri]KRO15614.1 excinuclease ABC subunit A [Lacticaseibacillus saniviri JCM 17471 = DSM 24301]MCG4280798.1 excinuclease ABC subunit UvrA [Lacticaseibacillus saniviri]